MKPQGLAYARGRGNIFMYCEKCGSEKSQEGVCPKCDIIANSTTAPVKNNKGIGFAIACLATGVLSLLNSFTIGCIFGIVSLVMGRVYVKVADKANGMVKAGRICAIFGIIINVLLIAAIILYYIVYVVIIVGIIGLGVAGGM